MCAVVVLGLSAHTTSLANNFTSTKLVNVLPNDYANVGIVAGSMTLVSVVLLYVCLPIDVCFEASKLPLDVAIFNSARAAGGDDKIRKYLQAVLIIGGTALVSEMAHALESRSVSLLHILNRNFL